MFVPTIERVSDLIKIKKILEQFDFEFKENLDTEDEIDNSLNNMVDLIRKDFKSIIMVIKTRL